MRRVISILIVLGLLLGMILAVTSCPKSEAPGAGGTVNNQPTMPPMQPSETAVPEGGAPEPAPDGTQPAAPPEGGEAAPPAEGGEGAPPAPAPPAPPAPGAGGK
jgi:hypothetical protein